jgi:probable phosphoglycerate mutase
MLVRHGETTWTISGRHTGKTEVPLTEHGRAQARLVGRQLVGHRFALVLVSPMSRAVDTCELAGAAGAVTDSDLVEWDYGEYDGLTTDAIRSTRPGWSLFADGVPGGETAENVGARADRVVALVRSTDGDVLIFSHGHLLRVLAARWVGLPPADGQVMGPLATAGVARLGYEREAPVVQVWNDTSHLTG